MILIGQYDSPFVRRVGVAMTLYGFAFEQRPWSVWADAEKIAAYNPLRRVPTLVLDDGEVLIESTIILDALDEMAGPERALLPRSGSERRDALHVCALATGMADKAVSLFYERLLHPEPSQTWTSRCTSQIGDVLDALEADRAARPGPHWLGERLTHADIAAACALRFVGEAHTGTIDLARWPALAAHAEGCEAMAAFQTIAQPFTVTLKSSSR
jgi:glutathione S-transferase